MVSGGVNCEQTSAVRCDLCHHSQVLHARPGEPLGKNAAQAVTDNVKRFAKTGWDAPVEVEEVQDLGSKTRVRTEARDHKIASFIRVTQAESLNSQSAVLRRYRVAPHLGNLLTWKLPLSPVRPRHDGEVDALRC